MPPKNGNGLSLRALEHFFLDSMARGYVADAPTQTLEHMPGLQIIRHEEGKLRLIDQWTTNAEHSFGTTAIWYDNAPVWFMQYHGRYERDALPFLKACRGRAYADYRVFHGGLGMPVDFQHAFGYTYTNTVRRGSSMAEFSAVERVHHQARVADLGYHEAHGRLLVQL